MFNLPEFQALQGQRYKDIQADVERERLVVLAERAGQRHVRLAGLAHRILERLGGVIHR